jgi:hypothetical protein
MEGERASAECAQRRTHAGACGGVAGDPRVVHGGGGGRLAARARGTAGEDRAALRGGKLGIATGLPCPQATRGATVYAPDGISSTSHLAYCRMTTLQHSGESGL